MLTEEDDPAMIFCDGEFTAPGFRFHPTDEELVLYYLKRKICKKRLKVDVIAETDVYKSEPEELPGLSLLKTGDRQWFFFSPRDWKYPNGNLQRANRATKHGYWKATGKDRKIECYSRSVGLKKTLVYYKGRAPTGERTDWVMHEYTLDEEELKRCQNVKDYYALYKVYKKSGPGPKNGEQYGAPYIEEKWDDDVPKISSSVDREIPVKQVVEVISNSKAKVNGEVHYGLNEIEDFMKQIADEAVLDLPQINDYTYTISQAASEETQSTIIDQYSREIIHAAPMREFNPNQQQCNVQASFDFMQSATTQMQPYEASDVTTSAPGIHVQDPPVLHEEDFLEMDDLLGPAPTVSNMENPLNNLQFEELDGLSEFDLYHDAAMFFHDMGPVDQGAISSHHQYMNSLANNSLGPFDYQLQPNPAAGNQVNHQMNPESTQFNNQLWSNTEIAEPNQGSHQLCTNIDRAEPNLGSLSYSTSGVVYQSSNIPSQENQNQGSNQAAGPTIARTTNQFSSAIWSFVESIPTTPASASENVLVHRAFERMTSFSRLRMSTISTNVAAGNGSEPVRAGRKRGLFFIPVVVALFAIFLMFMTSIRPWWRCLVA